MIAPPDMLLADKAYDADRLRLWLEEKGAMAVIPSTTLRRAPIPHDTRAYKARNLIECMFRRLKDFRRIATPYDKRAGIFLSAVCLAAAATWWTQSSLAPSRASPLLALGILPKPSDRPERT